MSKYITELPVAELNENGLAIKAGWLTVYSIEPEQREYQSASMEFLPVGVGLPALSYTDKPKLPGDGLALVRSTDGKRWESVSDYRGQIAYNTENGQPETVVLIGSLPDSLTLLAPDTPYDKWNGHQWVTDTAAQRENEVAEAEQKKQSLLTEAQSKIANWQTELQLDIISDDDKARLITWLNYIKEVQAVDTSKVPGAWPNKPE